MPQVRVCAAGELPDGECKVVTVGRKDIAVFRCGPSLYAIDDCCPHAGAPLSGGHVEDGIVTCPWHAWRFRLSDGAWADNPRVKTTSYSAMEVNGTVMVDVPDPATPPPNGDRP